MKRKKEEMTDAEVEALLEKLQRIKPAGMTLYEWLKRIELYLNDHSRCCGVQSGSVLRETPLMRWWRRQEAEK